jgi:hypothetical protein
VYTGQCPVPQRRAALELASLGNLLRYNSPDCPVYNGLSGEPAEQRLLRANGHLQAHLMRARSAQKSGTREAVHRTIYSSCLVYTGQPGGPRSQKLQRSNPNGLVTWLVHRTVRCTIRQSITTKRLVWWLCRCFGSDRTPGVAPQGVSRSRTVSTTVAKWFVPIARGTVDKIYRFGPLRDA